MRVIIATDEFVITGGCAKVALQCLEASLAAGLETAVLVGDDGKDVFDRFPGIKTIALNEPALRDSQAVGDVLGKTFNLRAYNAMKRLLDWAGPDAVVHVHGWSQILSPSIFYALARSSARVLVTAHDFFLNCPNGGLINYKSGEICRAKPMSMACLASNCDKRSYSHKLWRFNRQLVQGAAGDAFWSKVGVILVHENMEGYYDGSPFREFLTLRTPSEPLTRAVFDPWTNHQITYLGRMTWEKGVRTLAEALNITQKPAVLIGRGPLQDEIKTALPHCQIKGYLSDEEVAQEAAHSRYFIMPSRMPEPYGLVAAEAIMSGLPVIVSSNSLNAEEIGREGAGLVFRSGDAQSLAEAIRRMDDDGMVKALSLGARAYAHKITLSKEGWAKALIGIYKGQAEFHPMAKELLHG